MNSGRPPLVSVIVRSIDRAELERALESVAGQTYPHIEVVVVNARGPEHRKLGACCGEHPLRMVGTGAPLHRSLAANLGLESAEGDYLIFLDDDDWFEPAHVASLVAELDRDEGLVGAYAAVDCVRPVEGGGLERIYRFDQPFDRVRLMVENYIPMHAILFRRSALARGCRIDESLDVYEDWDFWIQLSRLADFRFVDRLGAYYWIGPGSGFGMAADQAQIDRGLSALFRKWRQLWTDADVVEIARYAKHHSMYHELVRECGERERQIRSNLEERLEDARREVEDAKSQISALRREVEAANRRARRHSARVVHLQELVAERQRRAYELETSTSWRIMAPVRAIAKLRRAPVGTLREGFRYVASRWRRMPPSAFLRAGLGRLTGEGRYARRLGGPVASWQQESAIHALQVTRHADPAVSIIVVANGNALATFSCLKSIGTCPPCAGFELILVIPQEHSRVMSEVRQQLSGVTILDGVEEGRERRWTVAAEHARAPLLVFLDADAIVLPGAVDELVKTMALWHDAGMVGARALLPDGRQHSAGVLLWQDASLSRFGFGDDADAPEYRYVRRTDACDDACVAVRRDLLSRLGCCEGEFGTPLYQLADMALRAREIGMNVYYQPAATAVRFPSEPVDEPALMLDKTSLQEKWSGRLGEQGLAEADLSRARDASAWRRVLVVDILLPTPDQDSGSLRMYTLLEELVALGVKVVFAGLYLDHRPPYRERLEQAGVEVLCPPRVCSVADYLRVRGDDFDAIVLSRVDVAAQLIDAARDSCPSARLIFDTVDLHFLREERMAMLLGDGALAEAAARRRETELGLMEKADATLVVSHYERELLAQTCPSVRVEVVSNIHDVHGSKAGFEEREGILFIGGFNHPPNEDAVIHYVNDILPIVRRELGPVKTWIIGSQPTRKVLALASDEVIVEGFVEDVSGHFARARLSIAPLRYGAGVKGKVNMSMAYGVPAVVSPIAAEGMSLTDGLDVMVGDGAEAFAQGIIRVYRDKALWETLSANGMRNIEQHFSRTAARETMRRILAEIEA